MNEDPQFQYEFTFCMPKSFSHNYVNHNTDTLLTSCFYEFYYPEIVWFYQCFDEFITRVVYDWSQHCTNVCCTLVARSGWVSSFNLLELWSPWKMGACLAPLHRFAWTTTCCISHCLLIIGNGCRTQQPDHAKSQKLHLSLPLCLICVRSLLKFFLHIII